MLIQQLDSPVGYVSLCAILMVGLACGAAEGVDAAAAPAAVAAEAKQISVQQREGAIDISVDGKPFTSYHFKGFHKPILYPVYGPDGVPMTRNYPMKQGVPGEASDHPHHESLWFTHGNVNGENFWHKAENSAKIVATKTPEHKVKVMSRSDAGGSTSFAQVDISAANNWVAADGEKIVCTDDTNIVCAVHSDGTRTIDYIITIHASHGDVTFKDDKEGTMGIRTNPALRLTPVNKGDKAAAHAVNSAGDKDKDLWGKKAKWVDYYGPVPNEGKGQVYGIAVFDHPDNLRHPTTWHAREYGLVAANPFGLSSFQKQPKGTGDHTIKNGESLTFHYRFVFHRGDVNEAKIAEQYEAWAKSK